MFQSISSRLRLGWIRNDGAHVNLHTGFHRSRLPIKRNSRRIEFDPLSHLDKTWSVQSDPVERQIIHPWPLVSFLSIYHDRYAASLGPKILHHFEQFFSIAFPLPKLDMFAIPDISVSAMENWGLITYRYSILHFFTKVIKLKQNAWDR